LDEAGDRHRPEQGSARGRQARAASEGRQAHDAAERGVGRWYWSARWPPALAVALASGPGRPASRGTGRGQFRGARAPGAAGRTSAWSRGAQGGGAQSGGHAQGGLTMWLDARRAARRRRRTIAAGLAIVGAL